MHMNVTGQSRKLEWLFVTPRYHRVHHLRGIVKAGANFGVLFTVWIGCSVPMSTLNK